MSIPPKARYRIVERCCSNSGPARYHPQKWRWWFPIWLPIVWKTGPDYFSSFSSLEIAKVLVAQRKAQENVICTKTIHPA